jgi:hypothetical protein
MKTIHSDLDHLDIASDANISDYRLWDITYLFTKLGKSKNSLWILSEFSQWFSQTDTTFLLPEFKWFWETHGVV